jgi:hypothetical protein
MLISSMRCHELCYDVSGFLSSLVTAVCPSFDVALHSVRGREAFFHEHRIWLRFVFT